MGHAAARSCGCAVVCPAAPRGVLARAATNGARNGVAHARCGGKRRHVVRNLGGVAGALEIPGLSRIVERIIIDQIKNFVVLPNKFSLSLVDAIPKKTLKCPDSAGVLR